MRLWPVTVTISSGLLGGAIPEECDIEEDSWENPDRVAVQDESTLPESRC